MVRALVGGLIFSAVVATAAAAQTAVIRGSVRDSTTNDPLSLVRVEIQSDGARSSAITDDRGRFRVSDVRPGSASIRVTRIGYRPGTLTRTVAAGDTLEVTIRLSAAGIPLDPVVVSASRAPETALDAPAAVSVVGREAIEEAVTLAPVELVRNAPGVDMATKGLIQRTFSVRGDLTANSGSLLLLTDYRYAALPSVSFNIPYLIAAGTEDLDRMELVRGPASALYGPGAPRGVLHLITRSPFESRGGAVAVTAGRVSARSRMFRVPVMIYIRPMPISRKVAPMIPMMRYWYAEVSARLFGITFASLGLGFSFDAVGQGGSIDVTASVTVRIKILFIKVSKTVRFHIGTIELPKPIHLAGDSASPRVWTGSNNGELHLNMGSRASDRGVAESQTDEGFIIEHVSGDAASFR